MKIQLIMSFLLILFSFLKIKHQIMCKVSSQRVVQAGTNTFEILTIPSLTINRMLMKFYSVLSKVVFAYWGFILTCDQSWPCHLHTLWYVARTAIGHQPAVETRVAQVLSPEGHSLDRSTVPDTRCTVICDLVSTTSPVSGPSRILHTSPLFVCGS